MEAVTRVQQYLKKCHDRYKRCLRHGRVGRKTGKPAEWAMALESGGLCWDDTPPGLLSYLEIPHKGDHGVDIVTLSSDGNILIIRQVKDYSEGSRINFKHLSTFSLLSQMLEVKPESMFGYISSLVPRDDRQTHGKGLMYMSFYNQMKKKFKTKTVANDNDNAWCSK